MGLLLRERSGDTASHVNSRRRTNALVITLILFAVFCAAHMQFTRPTWDMEWPGWSEDIDYLWFDAWRIRHGENPYARILSGDMRNNAKYPTYFPLFYYFAAPTQVVLPWFTDWLYLWRVVFFVFYIAIGLLISGALWRRGWPLLAAMAFLFWLFNRWTLHVLHIAHIDFVPLFFLVASLLLLKSRMWMSLLLLSVSLAFKHVAIILVPLYLIWVWQERRDVRRAVIAALVIASVPLLVAVPFLVWDFEAFVRSILFSATRVPDGHFAVESVDQVLWIEGPLGRVMMAYLLILLYAAHARRPIPMIAGSVIALMVFLDFNSVLFRQYMCWVAPLVPLLLLELQREDPAGPYMPPQVPPIVTST